MSSAGHTSRVRGACVGMLTCALYADMRACNHTSVSADITINTHAHACIYSDTHISIQIYIKGSLCLSACMRICLSLSHASIGLCVRELRLHIVCLCASE